MATWRMLVGSGKKLLYFFMMKLRNFLIFLEDELETFFSFEKSFFWRLFLKDGSETFVSFSFLECF